MSNTNENIVNGQTKRKHNLISKGRKKTDVEFDSDSDSDSDTSSDEENKEYKLDKDGNVLFEYNSRKIKSETGQIKSVEMIDFMCHRHFIINFGKNLNFVNGANGSGKSAILTALQLCLGANARNTGRGSNLSCFIREGSLDSSIIRVKLDNHGSDAYRPHSYGNSITIERTISKRGVSAFKTISACGDVVSTTREEIQSILKTYNIYLDNPCCLLTQDDSKKFIGGSEKDKYEFFLKATGLHRTKEELLEVDAKIKATEEQCAVGKNKLEMKQDIVIKLQRELVELNKLDKYQIQIYYMQCKLYWLEYYDVLSVVEEASERLEKVQGTREHIVQQVEEAQQAVSALGTIDDIQQNIENLLEKQKQIQFEMDEKHKAIVQKEIEVRQVERTVREIESDKRNLMHRMKTTQKEVDKLKQQALENSEGDELKLRKDIDQITKDMDDKSIEERQLRESLNEAHQDYRAMEEHVEGFNQEIRSIRNIIKKYNNDRNALISHSNSNSNNPYAKYSVFGRSIPEICQKVANCKSFKGPVYGPIGRYVKLTAEANAQHYGKPVERVIGGMLRNFIVTNKHDQSILSDLINNTPGGKADRISIISYSNTEKINPALLTHIDIKNVPTILQCLTIDVDVIYNYIVDSTNIDAIIISDENQCEEKYIHNRKFQYNIKYSIDLNGTTLKIIGGVSNSEAMQMDFKSLLSQDHTVVLNELNTNIEEQTNQLRYYENEASVRGQDMKAKKGMIDNLQNRINSIVNDMRLFATDKRTYENQLMLIQEANQIDTTAYEEEIRELQDNVEKCNDIINQSCNQISTLKSEMKLLNEGRLVVLEQKTAIELEMVKAEDKLQDFIVLRQNLKKEVFIQEKKLEAIDQEIQTNNAFIERKKTVLEEKKQIAYEKSKEILFNHADLWDGEAPIQLSVKEKNKGYLESKISNYTTQLEEGKMNAGVQGRTKAMVEDKLIKAEQILKKDTEQLEELELIIEQMSFDLKTRKEQWSKQLRRQSKRVDEMFDLYMQQKGFSGKIVLKHNEGVLHVVAQTDNLDSDTLSTDIRQCSGGERSYTSFCLLSALDDVIETPFRIMDEYDVFLDTKSRLMTLHAIKEHALSPQQRNKQFIIITPNSLDSIHTTKELRIHRLKPPERKSAKGLQQQTIH